MEKFHWDSFEGYMGIVIMSLISLTIVFNIIKYAVMYGILAAKRKIDSPITEPIKNDE